MFIQRSEETTIDNYDAISAFCLYESDPGYRDQRISRIRVILYLRNYDFDDEFQGVEIGHMELYRTTSYHSSWDWADCHSGMLVDMHYLKEEVCGEGKRHCNSTWYDENAWTSDHFFLTKMYLKPEFRQKGLGYEAMHTGLVECGANHNFVYIYPSRSDEDMGFKYLKKFYMGMDKRTRYSPKYGTIVCPIYNYGNTAKKESSRVPVRELSTVAG
jgi:GNAT superfamily N-acetyltransferase